jgi:hypothetical protein
MRKVKQSRKPSVKSFAGGAVKPAAIMIDHCLAELKALQAVFPGKHAGFVKIFAH